MSNLPANILHLMNNIEMITQMIKQHVNNDHLEDFDSLLKQRFSDISELVAAANHYEDKKVFTDFFEKIDKADNEIMALIKEQHHQVYLTLSNMKNLKSYST